MKENKPEVVEFLLDYCDANPEVHDGREQTPRQLCRVLLEAQLQFQDTVDLSLLKIYSLLGGCEEDELVTTKHNAIFYFHLDFYCDKYTFLKTQRTTVLSFLITSFLKSVFFLVIYYRLKF